MERKNLVMVGSFFIGVGYGYTWAYSSLILHISAISYTFIGIATSFNTITLAVFAPLWGRLFDKIHRGNVLLVLSGIGLVISLVALYIAKWDPLLFYILYFTGYALNAGYNPVSSAYSSLMFRKRIMAISSVFAIMNAGGAVGTFVGGILYKISPGISILGISLLAGVSLVMFLPVPRIESVTNGNTENNGKLTRTGLVLLLVGLCLMVICAGIFNTFFAIYYVDVIGGDASVFGSLFAVMLLLGGVAIMIYGKIAERYSPEVVVILAGFLYCISIWGVMIIRDPGIIIFIWALPCFPAMMVGSYTAASKYSSEKMRGQATGAVSFLTNMTGIGAILGGVLLDMSGGDFILIYEISLVLAVIALVMELVFFVHIKRNRKGSNREAREL